MKTIRKSVDEKLYISFEYDADVSSSSWATTGGTLSGAGTNGDSAYVYISAGTLGQQYTVTNDATLSDGQIIERSINVLLVTK